MKQFKKLIACVLAATLVLGSTTVVFGAEKKTSEEGSFGGAGNFEGTVDTEVFNVVVPVESVASSSAFDFILDPQGLITTTSGDAYDEKGITFATDGTMYFKVSDSQYDVKSQTLTAANKSSTDVNITLDAKVTVHASNAALALAEDNVWETSDTALEVYFEIVEVSGDAIVTSAAIATKGNDNVYTGGLESTLTSYEAAYKTIYDASAGAYQYVIDETLGVTADTYEFYITGACNTNADWSQYVEGADPKISVVWKVEMVGAETDEDEVTPPSPTPLIAVLEYNNSKTDLSVNFEYGTGDTKATAISSVFGGTSATTFGSNNQLSKCTVTNTTLVIPVGTLFAGANPGDVRYFKVVFNDSAKTSFVLKVTITE